MLDMAELHFLIVIQVFALHLHTNAHRRKLSDLETNTLENVILLPRGIVHHASENDIKI